MLTRKREDSMTHITQDTSGVPETPWVVQVGASPTTDGEKDRVTLITSTWGGWGAFR